jgi:hypothetical protein
VPKNLLKIPRHILERIQQFGQDDVVVACAKHITTDQVDAYAHLGLKVENGEIGVSVPFVPNPATRAPMSKEKK